MAYRIGIVGFGKIAEDQHLPVIRANPAFELTAVASQRGVAPEGVPHCYRDHRELIASAHVDAVAICTPPGPRHAIARDALLAGKHVLLEKPPAATLAELVDLEAIAQRQGRTVFTTWHSQHAAGVELARAALAGKAVRRLEVNWKEDVRRWHPGQQWIWEPGGFGVFDPGINALSILTRILPMPIFVRAARLDYPANRQAPIAAEIAFGAGVGGESLRATFDWRQTGPQRWEIKVETGDGRHLTLLDGGARLEIDGEAMTFEDSDPHGEYAGLYRRFAELLQDGRSEVHAEPFRLTADAFMIGRRETVEPFED
jgi:D-galactose 1-dehydrogenase